MSHEVFVDTSAWIAAIDGRDKYHKAAREVYTRLVEERHTLVTTNLVVAETQILIRRTGDHARAMRFLQSLRGSPRLHRVYSDASLETAAEAILEAHPDQDFSFADAVSFAVMQVHGLTQVFTFDRLFAVLGFQVFP